MSTENKFCEWFGHRDESTGSDRSNDFPSEGFVCVRCGHIHNENEWGGPPPAPKIRKVGLFFLAVLGAAALYFLTTRN